MKNYCSITTHAIITHAAFVLLALCSQHSLGEDLRQQCQKISQNKLSARYIMTQYINVQLTKKITRTAFDLIRSDANRVTYHYPNAGITDLWWLDDHQEIRLIKAFNKQQRAIEYEPLEVAMLVKQRWPKLQHLIAPVVLKKLKVRTRDDAGCLSSTHYTGFVDNIRVDVVWLDQLAMPKTLTWQDNKGKTEYVLQSLAPENTALLKKVDDFDTTDFADIGDNEADPFLNKMISLGFIHHSHGKGTHKHP